MMMHQQSNTVGLIMRIMRTLLFAIFVVSGVAYADDTEPIIGYGVYCDTPQRVINVVTRTVRKQASLSKSIALEKKDACSSDFFIHTQGDVVESVWIDGNEYEVRKVYIFAILIPTPFGTMSVSFRKVRYVIQEAEGISV